MRLTAWYLLVYFLGVSSGFAFAESVIFRFQGLSKAKSRICMDIFAESERDFFLEPEKLATRVVSPLCFDVSKSQPDYELKDVKSGLYSAAFFEDLVGDGKIQLKSVFGIQIPTSPIGFSQNPMILFGPPSFEKSSMLIDGDTTEMVVKMKRIFGKAETEE